MGRLKYFVHRWIICIALLVVTPETRRQEENLAPLALVDLVDLSRWRKKNLIMKILLAIKRVTGNPLIMKTPSEFSAECLEALQLQKLLNPNLPRKLSKMKIQDNQKFPKRSRERRKVASENPQNRKKSKKPDPRETPGHKKEL
jgi:hypothetical protein